MISCEQAVTLLQTMLVNPTAEFRNGQWDAIDSIVNHKRKLLVVERTGWGKSAIYFISAKLFRMQGGGPTIIVSPLLALMRNQIDVAKRLGIQAYTINSSNTEEWNEIKTKILNNQIDCLLISPERLANDDFIENVLRPIADNISLMVIDEAHCISDWGHDFRPDYRRIINIIRFLPANTPILCTTATANNRVIQDIQTQIGNIYIQRGSLLRESLWLQTLSLPAQSSRLAWLAQIIPKLKGTGIVYTLTTRDAEIVAKWLQQNNIEAKAYHASIQAEGFDDSNAYREYLEQQLIENKLKVLVATTALGMGYDKPDLSFVFHYQAPSSVVAYYQQVGRAGRAIQNAVGVLMFGKEDSDIHSYFRDSAFPSKQDIYHLLNTLAQHNGLSINQLEVESNFKRSHIEKILKLLSTENPSPVVKIKNQWHRTPVSYILDQKRITHLTHQRIQEWQQMRDYLHTTECKMRFLGEALDDHSIQYCNKCSSCRNKEILSSYIDPKMEQQAEIFLKQSEIPIEPRKIIQNHSAAFPIYQLPYRLDDLAAEEGRVLTHWGETGWGKMVSEGKHNGYFSDELVEAIAEMVEQRWQPMPAPQWVCCVPSLKHPDLVPNFAKRVANRLGIPFVDAVKKVHNNPPQKMQQNSFHQCHNLDGVFDITQVYNTPVLLIDDIVDSKWTLTVISALLKRAGSGVVYPVALASSATSSGNK